MTAVADLYAQEDILEMQCRSDVGKPLAHGAVSEVSRIYAAVTQPSTVVSHQIERRNHVVVLKRSGTRLFLPGGQYTDTAAMRSFISELRILSQKAIREHPNIVKLLGVHWDYFETCYPEPSLLLEKANTDLARFQPRQDTPFIQSPPRVSNRLLKYRHRSLPFETKKSISLDIARGLAALHQSGVIHGDLKPQNVLIFKMPTLHAKIADFSHSLLDTRDTRTLVGGTWVYSAPEWDESASTEDLLKTDIYSYGLIFGGFMLGDKLVATVRRNPPFNSNISTEETIRRLKVDDHMNDYLFRLVHLVDRENLDSNLHEFPLIYIVFENTLQLDPKTRNLDRVLDFLGGR
ncbi:uncharacterized protein Z519_07778 [Cladophialophora bantiana CBS 173.52]|uniref:Protein kinase domain-containing protein n=1 Tax=Cladophialophora bantiana (strain ATCC 10958 / CBS 173.52 / CDC B-1940 / NIH 8579) TaxID=1442370 RepID=A0A0D2HEV6_CLAB1|nr:uncharacterized protein Z519_07778 [Cladophialophora bantiana CBS 173.52]KIW91808.1 hypothetical protein Z519_07778 [Cladophialophora bantiana CBS 173.52]